MTRARPPGTCSRPPGSVTKQERDAGVPPSWARDGQRGVQSREQPGIPQRAVSEITGGPGEGGIRPGGCPGRSRC